MDLLYSRYSNPMEFMRLYMEQERFGEFVTNIIDMDNKRKNEASEKDNENKLFDMYVHSMPDKSFNDWKDEVIGKSKKEVPNISEEEKKDQVVKIINDSSSILDSFSL